MSLADDELAEILFGLGHDDPRKRVIMLKVIADDPTGEARVLPYVEQLLEDKTPVLLSIPYTFGEVRWMAAHALASECQALGLDKQILVSSVTVPITINELSRLAETNEIAQKGGTEGLLQGFAILRERGKLPLYDLKLPDYC